MTNDERCFDRHVEDLENAIRRIAAAQREGRVSDLYSEIKAAEALCPATPTPKDSDG